MGSVMVNAQEHLELGGWELPSPQSFPRGLREGHAGCLDPCQATEILQQKQNLLAKGFLTARSCVIYFVDSERVLS